MQSPLLVRLKDIPASGLTLERDLSASWAVTALAGTEADPNSLKLRADVSLKRLDDNVYVDGTLSGEVCIPCSRCTRPARLEVSATFQTMFVPSASEGSYSEDVELTEEDLDQVTYAHDEIDLANTIREELLLTLPISHVCDERCKGLCSRCGADWNEGPCDCSTEPVDDRWSALRNLKV